MASSSSRSKDQKNDEKKEDEEEEIKLPPPLGYKFFPSEEILMDYVKLRNGIVDGTRKLPLHVIPTIENLYSFNPDQIPFRKSLFCFLYLSFYFFAILVKFIQIVSILFVLINNMIV